MKKQTIYWIIGIVVVLLIVWYGYKQGWFAGLTGNIPAKPKVNGTSPTGRQRMCKSDGAGCYVQVGLQKEYVDCSACGGVTA